MYTCSNCGNEYDTKYLQCPQCGCVRSDIKNAQMHDKRTERIGAIIAIVFIIALIGIIGYGVYLLLNPFRDGPTITNIASTTATTTTTEETSSTSTTTRTTTTKYAGSESKIGSHSFVLPEGYVITGNSNGIEIPTSYNADGSSIYIQKGEETPIYFAIIDKTSFKYNEENKKDMDALFASHGYGPLKVDRLTGKLCYYAIKEADGASNVVMYYNRRSNLVITTYRLEGTTVSEDSIKTILDIISTIE